MPSSPSADRLPRLPWLPWTTAAGLLLLHLALAAPLRGPVLFGDETAYLGMARFLAGRAPDLQLASRAMRHGAYLSTGYSVLLAPLCALAASPLASYRAALAVNAVCAAAAFLVLAAFGRRTLGMGPGPAVLAALAASLYPAFLLEPLLSWTEALLILLVPGLVLAMQRLAERRTVGAALLVAALAGGTYWVHQRTLGLLALTLAVLALLHRRFALPLRAALTAAGGTLGIAAVARLVNGAVWAAVSPHGTPLSEAGLVASVLRPAGLWQAALSTVGQLWYLAAATLGLGLLGAVELASPHPPGPPLPPPLAPSPGEGGSAAEAGRWRPSPGEGARGGGRGVGGEGSTARLGAAFALAAAAVLFFTSAAFTIVPDRVDKLFYGRYWEPALGMILVAALARLFAGPLRWRTIVPLALAAPLLGGALVALRGKGAFEGLLNDLNIFGVTPWVLAMGRVRVLRISGMAAGLALAVLALARRRPGMAAVAVAALFTVGGLFVQRTALVPGSRATQASLRIPVRLREIPGHDAVAYDEGHLTDRGFYAYPFWIDRKEGDGRHLLWFDSRTGPPPAPLVISARAWPEAPRGARLVYPESAGDQGLWVLPGSAQERLAAAGSLIPLDPAAPLPDAACRSRISRLSPQADGMVRVASGGTAVLPVRVAHRGMGAPWVAAGALANPGGAVRVGVVWSRKDGGEGRVSDERTELPYTLAPGEEAAVDVALVARTTGGEPLPPGSYEVQISLVQELVRWFPDDGDGALTVPVEVRALGIIDRLREIAFGG
jgi:hypothetical protein